MSPEMLAVLGDSMEEAGGSVTREEMSAPVLLRSSDNRKFIPTTIDARFGLTIFEAGSIAGDWETVAKWRDRQVDGVPADSGFEELSFEVPPKQE